MLSSPQFTRIDTAEFTVIGCVRYWAAIKSGGHYFGRLGRFCRAGRWAPQATKFAGGGVFTVNTFSQGEAVAFFDGDADGATDRRHLAAGEEGVLCTVVLRLFFGNRGSGRKMLPNSLS